MGVTRRFWGTVLCGVATAVGAGILGLPGNGAWLGVAVGAGAVAAILLPGLRGLLGGFLGIVLQWPPVAALMPGASLVWLAIAIEGSLFAYGFLVGAIVGRAWRLRSALDTLVLVGTVLAVGLAVILVNLAEGFAENPP